MKEELIKKLLEYAKNTETFLSSEVTEIFKELIFFGKILSIIAISVSLFFMGLSVFFIREIYLIVTSDDSTYEHDDFIGIYGILSIFFVVSLLCLIVFSYNLMEIFLAPKVFILEFLKRK